MDKYDTCLGCGSFGIVLKSIHNHQSAPFATKFIFDSYVNDTERRQILRECSITTELSNHDNIVQVIQIERKEFTPAQFRLTFSNEVLTTESQRELRDVLLGKADRYNGIEGICLKMELCGENLRYWLSKSHEPMDLNVQIKQIKIITGLIMGLKFLHDNSIIHRDLKPENVMFSQQNFILPVKIGDFGLSRKIQEEGVQTSRLTSRPGTFEYMAPEAYTNEYSFQADLYSLGLVIWEVVQPIKFHERKTLFDRLVNEKMESLVKGLPLLDGVEHLVIGLSRRDTSVRIQNIEEVMSITKSWDASFPAIVKRPTPPLKAITKLIPYISLVSAFVLLCISIYLGQQSRECIASNAEELKKCLKFARRGCIILLSSTEYLGPFELSSDGVKISGYGRTVIRCDEGESMVCFQITGHDNIISNIKVMTSLVKNGINLIGSRNVIKNSEFSGRFCIDVTGDGNQMSQLNIYHSRHGIRLFGSRNIINQVEFKTIDHSGIILSSTSNENTLSNLVCENVKRGIYVSGSKNVLENITMLKGYEESGYTGAILGSFSSFNNIHNLSCVGYQGEMNDLGVRISSDHSSVWDSKCGPVLIVGNNVTLINVEVSDFIRVESEGIVQLVKSNAKELQLRGTNTNLTVSESRFVKETVDED